MKMFVNTSGVPVKSTKPKLDGHTVGGTPTEITIHPYQVWPFFVVQSEDTLKCLNKQTASVYYDKILVVKTYWKKR